MNVRLGFAVTLLSFAGLVACTSSSGDSAASATPEQACAGLASALSGKESCLGPFAPATASASANDNAVCLAEVSAPGAGLTPAAIDACSAAIGSSLSCPDLLNGKLPSACTPAGTLANDSPCGNSVQCSSGFCAVVGNTNCGTCVPNVVEGGACVNGACPAGLYCSNQACVAHGQAGDACGDQAPCALGIACISGMCQTAAAGAQCDHPGDVCNVTDPSICNTQKVCETFIVAQPGQSCSLVTKTICGGGSSCSDPVNGTCALPKQFGEGCSETDTCVGPLVCTAGKCAAFDPSTCK